MHTLKTPEPTPGRRYFAQVDLFKLMPAETAREDGKPLALRIPVLPEGTFKHPAYGDLEWTPAKFEQMQANFDAQVCGYQPMLNFDHATANPFASEARAAGWFTALEAEAGAGLFAQVELTPCGEEAVRNKEYRYISAEVADTYTNSRGQTFANVIVGAALTNCPFHETMPGLFSQGAYAFSLSGLQSEQAGVSQAVPTAVERENMDPFKLFRRVFGLADTTSDEEVVLAAVRSAQPGPAAEPPAPKQEPSALGLSAVAADVVTLSKADHAALVAAQGELETFRQKAQDAETALLKQQAEAAVDGYVTAGKIAPAQKESALEFALSQPALFKKLYDEAPQVVPVGSVTVLSAGPGEGAETFAQKVLARQRETGCDYLTASEQLAAEEPALYEAHRKAATRGDK